MKNMCYETSYQNIVSEVNVMKKGSMMTSEPVSRTYQYRKVMKPMLERKRRARINRCLDELKELMVSALQAEGENVSKLEKADILEMTVSHLHKLRRQQRLAHANPVINEDRFRAGFTHAANEVSRVLASIPGVDITLGTKLMTHLGVSLNTMDGKNRPLSIQTQQQQIFTTPPISPTSSLSSGYSSSRENGVSVIMSTANQTMLRTPTPTNETSNFEPLTPMSSRCSQSSQSPQPIDYHRSTTTPTEFGLLKVAAFAQQTAPSSSLWRPF
jgi:hairy-and-enhancer-of-split protein